MITLRKLFATFILIQAFAAAMQAQAPETSSSNKSGVITGSVTSSSGELPANTTVYVSPLGANIPPQTAPINSDGAFRIENLEIGVYRVWALAPGFVSDPQNTTPESRGIYHTGDSVALTLRKGGVITGRVLKSNDAPVIAATVRAFRIRDENGKPTEGSSTAAERMTDDRGVYRLYGLLPGTYVVSAGGATRASFGAYGATAHDQDVPTYAPSATRDTAQEVVVRSGDEATADIQYRGEPGHAISGTVVGILSAQGTMSYGGTVNLTDVKTRTMLMAAQSSSFNEHVFVFYGLPDGEYELVAQQFSQSRDVRASEPKRIKVQGADVTGVNLTVTPLPAITGRVILDSSSPADCVKRRATAFQETVVSVRRQKRPAKPASEETLADAVPLTSLEQIADDVPNAKGDFILRNLRAGTYRLSVQLPSAAWYFRSVTLGPNTKATDSKVISDGVSVKQSVSGLTVTISEGAAGLGGRVTVAEGQRLPPRTIVYLVPAEKENATNLLRYFEARAESDGAFNIRNVVPGEYLIHARAAQGDTPRMISIREDPDLRTVITREAEKAKQSVTLKACERLDNYELAYPPTTKP